MSEGASAAILEDFDAATARGANVMAEVIGYGSSTVVSRQGVADYKTALGNVIKQSLQTAGLQPADIGHIHAHGLSTQTCDRDEAAAVHEVFGDKTPVTAL